MENQKDLNKNVLIITYHYLDKHGGGSLGSRAYINAFAQIFPNSTLIYPESEIEISSFFPVNLKLIPCSDLRSKFQKGLDIYKGNLHRFKNFASNYINENKPDIVIFDHSIISGGIIDFAKSNGCKIITIHHNVEIEYIKDNKPNLMILFPFNFFLKKIEGNSVMKSDLNLTVTKEDELLLKQLYSPVKKVNFSYWGTFEYPNLKHNFKRDYNNNTNLVFTITGNLSFQQSEESIIRFINGFFPVLKKRIKNAQLIIAGRNPSNNLIKVCNNFNGIELIPNPKDMDLIVNTSDFYICPIDMGSGVKLRVMDGLKAGLPIIVHEKSSRGYEMFRDSNFFFVYNDIKTFENQINRLQNAKTDKIYVFSKYLERFSYDAGVNRLSNILKENEII